MSARENLEVTKRLRQFSGDFHPQKILWAYGKKIVCMSGCSGEFSLCKIFENS